MLSTNFINIFSFYLNKFSGTLSLQSLYSDGHEVASHSISHSFGEQFSKKKWLKEMAGQREILAGTAFYCTDVVIGSAPDF